MGVGDWTFVETIDVGNFENGTSAADPITGTKSLVQRISDTDIGSVTLYAAATLNSRTGRIQSKFRIDSGNFGATSDTREWGLFGHMVDRTTSEATMQTYVAGFNTGNPDRAYIGRIRTNITSPSSIIFPGRAGTEVIVMDISSVLDVNGDPTSVAINDTYAMEFQWDYDSGNDETELVLRFASDGNFANMVRIGHVIDPDPIPDLAETTVDDFEAGMYVIKSFSGSAEIQATWDDTTLFS